MSKKSQKQRKKQASVASMQTFQDQLLADFSPPLDSSLILAMLYDCPSHPTESDKQTIRGNLQSLAESSVDSFNLAYTADSTCPTNSEKSDSLWSGRISKESSTATSLNGCFPTIEESLEFLSVLCSGKSRETLAKELENSDFASVVDQILEQETKEIGTWVDSKAKNPSGNPWSLQTTTVTNVSAQDFPTLEVVPIKKSKPTMPVAHTTAAKQKKTTSNSISLTSTKRNVTTNNLTRIDSSSKKAWKTDGAPVEYLTISEVTAYRSSLSDTDLIPLNSLASFLSSCVTHSAADIRESLIALQAQQLKFPCSTYSSLLGLYLKQISCGRGSIEAEDMLMELLNLSDLPSWDPSATLAREQIRLVLGCTNDDLEKSWVLIQHLRESEEEERVLLRFKALQGTKEPVVHKSEKNKLFSDIGNNVVLSNAGQAESTSDLIQPQTIDHTENQTRGYYLNQAHKHREDAYHAIREAARCFKRADLRSGAGFYAQRFRDEKDNVSRWEEQAAKALVKERQKLAQDTNTIDLHHLTYTQAIAVVSTSLNIWWSHPTNSSDTPIKIITGKGTHSAGGVGILKERIPKYLDSEGWRWVWEGSSQGCLVVTGVKTPLKKRK